ESFLLMNCVFGKVVISDDGSNKEHLENVKVLKDKYFFDLICAETNSGLGNNINKGQDAIITPYTLYIQEDFVPAEIFPKRLKEALEFMKKDEELDIVRFYAYFPYPYLKNIDDTFSEMYISPFSKN